LPPKQEKWREIPREFDLTAVQGHPRSSILVFSRVFSPPHTSLTPHSGWTPWDINVNYTSLKSTFCGLQFRGWQYGSIFIWLAVIASETREMSWNSKTIWPYSSSGSSKVIDIGANGKESPYVTSC